MNDVETLKAAACGYWPGIIQAVGGIDNAVLDGRHYPCPRCGGVDRFRAFNDFTETGGVICGQCHNQKNSDGIATIRWLTGAKFGETLALIADYLQIDINEKWKQNGRQITDVVAEIAKLKSIPLASLKAFGAENANRGKLAVCRLPMFGPDGKQCSSFDLAIIDKKWMKGIGLKGKPVGLFLRNATLPEPGQTLHITEGAKDSAALDAEGFQAVGIPRSDLAVKFATCFRGCDVVIVPDRDQAGENGAKKTAGRLAGVAKSVRIATLPGELKAKDGDGVREILALQDGSSLLKQAINDASEWDQKLVGNVDDERVPILVDPLEHRVNAEAAAAILGDNYYTRGGVLVQTVESANIRDGIDRPEKSQRLIAVPKPTVRDRLSETIRFYEERAKEDGIEVHDIHPPQWCVEFVHACRHWPTGRPLSGIIDVPTMRPDGTILSDPGYDPTTGLLLAPRCDVPAIPQNPSTDEVFKAVVDLLNVVIDFPFAKLEHQSAWLASVLTVVARSAIPGPAPLFLLDANVRAAGKSLLADLVGIISTGQAMSRMPNPRGEDEMRKRILAIALSADPSVLIDNVSGKFGNAALDAVLTGTNWKDRILGRSEIVDLPISTVWFASGNNVVLIGDTSRRCCHVRLHSTEEKPEERTGFACPDIKQHVRENRGRLVAAALTILRGFVADGRPNQHLTPWGSFEEWSDLIRSALAWCGQADPGDTREELRDGSDSETSALQALVECWPEIDPDNPDDEGVRVADVLQRIGENPAGEKAKALRATILEYFGEAGNKLPSARSLSMRLNHMKRRIVDGRYLDCVRDRKNTNVWAVRSATKIGQGNKS